jgi:hypothetical protein
MTMPPGGQQPQGNLLQFLGDLAKLPSPEKLFTELQRFNNNMEKMQPDKVLTELQRLNNNLDKLQLYPQDIRALTQAIQSIKVNELLLSLGDAIPTLKRLVEKLWGK